MHLPSNLTILNVLMLVYGVLILLSYGLHFYLQQEHLSIQSTLFAKKTLTFKMINKLMNGRILLSSESDSNTIKYIHHILSTTHSLMQLEIANNITDS